MPCSWVGEGRRWRGGGGGCGGGRGGGPCIASSEMAGTSGAPFSARCSGVNEPHSAISRNPRNPARSAFEQGYPGISLLGLRIADFRRRVGHPRERRYRKSRRLRGVGGGSLFPNNTRQRTHNIELVYLPYRPCFLEYKPYSRLLRGG